MRFSFHFPLRGPTLGLFSPGVQKVMLPKSDYGLAVTLAQLDCHDAREAVRGMNELLEESSAKVQQKVRFGKWLGAWRVDKALKIAKAIRAGENYLQQAVAMLREQLEAKQVTGAQVLEMIRHGNFGLAQLFHSMLEGILLWDQTENAWVLLTEPKQAISEYVIIALLMQVLGNRALSVGTNSDRNKLAATLWSATATEHGLWLARAFLGARREEKGSE